MLQLLFIYIFTILLMTAPTTPSSVTTTTTTTNPRVVVPETMVDAVVVGTGLAGLVAALELLDRGGRVVLIEKQGSMGGNTIKASSGINFISGTPTPGAAVDDDDYQRQKESFLHDTLQSAGSRATPELIQLLVEQSADGMEWLQSRAGLEWNNNKPSQLGGHSHARTFRPAQGGTIGYALVSALKPLLEEYQTKGQLQILLNTQVTELLTTTTTTSTTHDSTTDPSMTRTTAVTGVKAQQPATTDQEVESFVLPAHHVVLATGGFAASHINHHNRPSSSSSISTKATKQASLLAQHAPHDYYLQLPYTVGDFSTGDGVVLGTNVGASMVDMDQIQIHPTGFVGDDDDDSKRQPQPQSSQSKILCAEVLRGVGGILLDSAGQRFVDELGTRRQVTQRMLEQWKDRTSNSDSNIVPPPFYLVLPEAGAAQAGQHVGFYTWKQLLHKCKGLTELAEYFNGKKKKDGATAIDKYTLRETLTRYQESSRRGQDDFGKTVFPHPFSEDLDTETFYVGQVTPVLHYCMGGLAMNAKGQVLKSGDDDNSDDNKVIPGLYAIGEVTGGVHGENRLAGNSLLECLVFGRIVGQGIPIVAFPSRVVEHSEYHASGRLESVVGGHSQDPGDETGRQPLAVQAQPRT